METLEQNLTFEQFEQQRVNHSVLLLREATHDRQQKIFEHVCDLETSYISEILEGESRTEFPFEVRGGKLFALQPEGITDWQKLHQNGVSRAAALARRNPRFNFYKDFAEAELEESRLQENLARAGEEATLFTLSLCGNDLASAEDLRQVGRDPELQKAYFRLSTFDGKLNLKSYAKDGVTLADARRIYKDFFGIDLPKDASSIDILRTPVILPGAHHDLLDKITPSLQRNNYKFVLEQPDLLGAHMSSLQDLADRNLPPDLLAEMTSNLRYDIMSSFKQRLEGNWIELESLSESIAYAGSVERDAGTEFAGCDSVVANRSNPSAKAGYVNAIESLLSSLKRQEFESKWCPNCLPKPKAGKKVMAWRQGDKIGCKNCNHIVDVCTKKVIQQGKTKK